MRISKNVCLLFLLTILATSPAAATEHDHATVDDDLLAPALLEAKRAYHARRQVEAVQVRSHRDGVLRGKRVGVSAGHGIIWSSDAGAWLFQRATEAYPWGGVREDIHTNQIVIDYLAPMIERAGGEVVTMRERSYIETSTIFYNDTAGADYVETGEWETGGSEGHGGTYRFAYLAPGGEASASWRFTVPSDGTYPVYVYFLASDNRTNSATYEVTHATGTSERTLDQSVLRPEDWSLPGYPNVPPGATAGRRYNDLWHYLGEFPFREGEQYEVRVTNVGGDAERVVIADAIHVGGGREAAPAPNGSRSGRARWEEGAMPYLDWLGAPSWVFVGDVTARPLYAVYQGVDAYLAVHSNCCNGQGTSTWVWYPEMYIPRASWPAGYAAANLPPGTLELAELVHGGVMERARAGWMSDWRDGGIVGANFGELRPIRMGWYEDVHTYGANDPLTIPATLIELAFHDTEHDSRYLREEDFRHDVARGMFSGIVRQLAGGDAPLPPLPPEAVAGAIVDQTVEISFEDEEDALEPSSRATAFKVYWSDDGLLFGDEPQEAMGSSAAVALTDCEPLFARVTAVNDAGESLDSPVVGARLGWDDGVRVLIVDGIDRVVRTEEDPDGPRAWAADYMRAVLRARPDATVEITTDDLVPTYAESDLDLVVWATGQTSVRDESLNGADRAALQGFLERGVSVVFSGAETVWELAEVGAADTQAFVRDVLQVDYVSDDAGTMTVDASGLGLGAQAFGDCSSDTICIHYPDVIAPRDGGTVLATYDGGGAAIVETGNGAIVAGFPLESVAADGRESFIAAVVGHALRDVPDVSGACPELDPDPDPDPDPDTDGGMDGDGGMNGGTSGGDAGSDGDDTGSGTGADAGADADVPDPIVGRGCGCTSTGAPASGLFWVLLFGVARVARRRRVN